MSEWGANRPTGPRDWTVIERFLLTELESRRRASRWRFLRRAAFLLVAVLIVGNLVLKPGIGPSSLKPHVAVIEVDGVIAAGMPANADSLIQGLEAAFKTESARAVVLRINSPGGSPVQSDQVFRELQRLRAAHPDKPVHAVIGDVGASGAYYIAVGADRIFVNPASIVGSIGVIMPNYGVPELLRKLGVEDRTLAAGDNKNLLSPTAPINPAQREHVQTLLDAVHRQFITAVKTGRGERLLERSDIFSGLFWDGEEAIRLGLADDIGSLQSVARDVLKLEELVDYTVRPDPFAQLFRGLGVELMTGLRQGLVQAVGSESTRLGY